MISVDELWLKGGNRKEYVKVVRKHMVGMAKAFHEQKVEFRNVHQQLFLEIEGEFNPEYVERLQCVPGLSAITPVKKIESSIESLQEAVVAAFEEFDEIPKTFKVEAKRVDKSFPMNSMDINRALGGTLLKKYDGHLKVDVRNPECMVRAKVYSNETFLSVGKLKGTGGLPVGTSGHLISLLSGGFDSPVASYMMAKRGCKQTFAFFYAYPFVGEEVKEKIIDLFKVVGKFQVNPYLHIIPIGNLQKKIAEGCREEYRTLLFRRAMVELSAKLGDRFGAQGLCTGDSLGQVSSQTIGAITLMDRTSPMTIFRPLVGMNKIEIVNLSKHIGAHDISVKPHDDACSLFATKHPILRPDAKYWADVWDKLDLSDEMDEVLDQAEVYRLELNGELTKK
jgi:thiamine biosynthesis protein ThiI